MIDAIRTPEDRFSNLPDFAWPATYIDDLPGYEGLRMALVDTGPRDADHVVLCLHGQPTWGYLYRSMIPVFEQAGARVLVPDLFGFGRSDKPTDDAVYTFDFHRGSLLALIDRLELSGITLVLHDWGGILGLTLPVDRPDLASRLIVTNTGLVTGTMPLGKAFEEWRDWVKNTPDLAVDRLMQRACPQLSEAEAAAYGAPFPTVEHKAGVRRFPQLVPDHPEAPGAEVARRALSWWRKSWQGKSFLAVGAKDPIFSGAAMEALRKLVSAPEPMVLEDAGHFVPEWGESIARAALTSFGLD